MVALDHDQLDRVRTRHTVARVASVHHREGLWREHTSQRSDLNELIDERPVAYSVIEEYARRAVKHALVRVLDDESHFAEIVGFVGIWGEGDSQLEALEDLRDALLEWVLLKVADRDGDLPTLDGLDLNTL